MLLYFASNFGAKIQLIINKVKEIKNFLSSERTMNEFFIARQAKNIESRILGIRGMKKKFFLESVLK